MEAARSTLMAIGVAVALAVTGCTSQSPTVPPGNHIQPTHSDSVTVPSDMVGTNAGDAQSELARIGLAGQVSSSDSTCLTTPSLCGVTKVPQAGETVSGGTDVVLDVAPISALLTVEPAPTPASDTVAYTVTGHRAGTITYQNGDGNASQVTDTTKLPWTVSFTVPAGTEGFLYVSAQNAGSGTIGCSISVNGQVVKQNSSTGMYAIVECSQ